jgi:ferredoxin-NADP reductase
LVLTTAKSGLFVHSSHRGIASLRRKSAEPRVEINPALGARRGLAEGDWAIVSTSAGGAALRVRFNSDLHERVVVSEFGWWEGCEALGLERTRAAGPGTTNINAVLGDRSRDPVSGSVPLRAVSCDIAPHPAANRGAWRGQRPFIVRAVEKEAVNVTALHLSPKDGAALPGFRAGQFVLAGLPGGTLSRAYSLTGAALGPRHLSIAVGARLPGIEAPGRGSLSEQLGLLVPGDELLLEPAAGLFTPPLSTDRPLIFAAAGVGITPFISYLETLAGMGAAGGPPGILLLHGCRDRSQQPFAESLAALERLLPRLRRVTFFSAPGEGGLVEHERRGRIDLALAAPLIPRRPLAYLCGSPGFNLAVTEALAGFGMPRFDIMAEAFTSPRPPPGDLRPREVRLARQDLCFTWHPGRGSLLDAGLAAGATLPSGCGVGQCGNCAVRVVAGDFIGAADADDEPGHCLTCQSLPLTDLVLDV